MVTKPLGWAIKNSAGLVGAVGKALRGAGDEVVSALGKWWSKGAKGAEQAGEAGARMAKELENIGATGSNLANKLQQMMVGGTDNAKIAGQRIRSELRDVNDRIAKTLNAMSRGGRQQPNAYEKSVLDQYQNLYRKVFEKDQAMMAFNKAHDTSGPAAALARYDSDPVLQSIPEMRSWAQSIREVLTKQKQISGATSKHLGNDSAFVSEFLGLKRNTSAPGKLAIWEANPQNAAKLQQLYKSEKISEILGAGKMTTRQKLVGLTPLEQATNLGIGAGALAGAGQAIGVFNWFDSKGPEKVSANASDILTRLGEIKTVGYGTNVLNNVNKSLTNLKAISNQARAGLGSNPEQASTRFVKEFTNELATLQRHMGQWQAVVDSSEDPDKAEAIGEEINGKLEEFGKELQELGGVAGFTGGGFAATRKQDSSLARVQELLSSQYGMDVSPTGRLDRGTINALRELEQRFNEQASDNRFTGAFVRPELNYVISYDDLMEASRRIRKY